MIVQCPACLRLVDISTAVANASGLALQCPQCQHMEVLPEGDAAAAGPPVEVVRAPVAASPKASAALTPSDAAPAGTLDPVDPELIAAIQLLDEDDATAPLVSAFADLLRSGWDTDEGHKSLASRAQLGGQLALLGRAYREVRQARPEDGRAVQGQELVVNLAMSTMTPLRGAASGPSPTRLVAKVAVIVVGVIIALLAMNYISSTLNGLGGS